MSAELQQWLRSAHFRAKRELVGTIREQAALLQNAIKDAAPVRTGRLRDSIKVRRTRNDLKLYVTAGGDETAEQYAARQRYVREVVIGSGDTAGIARGGPAGVVYDYSRALEFGTTKMAAQPFFYTTAKAMEGDIRDAIEEAVGRALAR